MQNLLMRQPIAIKQQDNDVTIKKITTLIPILLIMILCGSGLTVTSCNKQTEEIEDDNYLASESVAITAFSLQPDLKVMKNLDSVYFSIDLEHGVVFNADSLPKGTNVTKLIPKITYPQSVTSAVIEMKGGTHREDGTTNYHTNSGDTIDFTADVTITLSTSGNAIQKTYKLKVNVHKEDPDTLYWDKLAAIKLPSRLPNPAAQKSVAYGKGVICLIEENDGTYTISDTGDIFGGVWNKNELALDFTPVVSSLTAAPDGTLYLTSEEGALLLSANGGATWNQTDYGWNRVIGMFGDTLLGINSEGSGRTMISWPRGAYPEIELPADFPINGFSSPIEFNNRWSPDPTIVVFGGYPYATSGFAPSWAFDGSQWVNIAEIPLPALSGLSVVSYYSYLNSASNGILKEFEVYLAFGGRDSAGNTNKTVYVSYDHGISWQTAQKYVQLPDNVEAGYMVDALSIGMTLESNLSDRWKKTGKRRIPFEINGDILSWNCPYIFLFGGYNDNDILNSDVRSGVLQRLTFAPLF